MTHPRKGDAILQQRENRGGALPQTTAAKWYTFAPPYTTSARRARAMARACSADSSPEGSAGGSRTTPNRESKAALRRRKTHTPACCTATVLASIAVRLRFWSTNSRARRGPHHGLGRQERPAARNPQSAGRPRRAAPAPRARNRRYDRRLPEPSPKRRRECIDSFTIRARNERAFG